MQIFVNFGKTLLLHSRKIEGGGGGVALSSSMNILGGWCGAFIS